MTPISRASRAGTEAAPDAVSAASSSRVAGRLFSTFEATAAIAAIMNAFSDAIPGSGHKIQMPATPEKVWRACQEMATG